MLQALFNELLDQYIEDGEARHTDKHTNEAEESRHDRDGYDDPYGGQARGGTVDTGNNDITVNLLNDEDHDGKYDSIRGLAYEEDERAWDRTDERTEDRDDIRDGDNDTDQRSIGHSGNLDEQEADKSDENGVEDCSDEVFAERSVCQRNEIHDLFVILFAENRFHDLFRLCADVLLGTKEVNCENEAERNVEDSRSDGLDKLRQHRQIFLNQLVGAGHDVVQGVVDRADDSIEELVGLREGYSQGLYGSDVFGIFFKKIHQADFQLRNDHGNEKRKECNDGQHSSRYGQASACGARKNGFLSSGTEDFFLVQFH